MGVPHSGAAFAQGWDSTKVERVDWPRSLKLAHFMAVIIPVTLA
jgi:hypothetical protein